jgi:L-aspartate oxidase
MRGGAAPPVHEADILVIGAGAAGLTAALGCVPRRVVVLTKTRLSASGGGGASVWAQGGVASAVGEDDDPALHAADTLAAGAGLNDARIVSLLTGEGPQRIRALLEMGARFDRDAGGRLALGREAAHSRRRILHAHGDATGAEVVRTLVEAVHHEPAIQVVDRTFALDLIVENGVVVGVAALRPDGRLVHYRAPAVVLATGGAGQLFLHTTNPREATADGLAMAARAGALLVDLEFVQFHPTALAPTAPAAPPASPGAPLPLLTEALRGEGAVLIDDEGTRFMIGEHPDRELAPRDVVARAIWKRLEAGRRVFLDAREAVGAKFPERFPTVFALCLKQGIDPRIEPMPVVPAAHYHMGGVAVDASGRTSLPGLWACGEVAATGAHGANRLASNSLLEALVFGARVAAALLAADRGLPGRPMGVVASIPHPAFTTAAAGELVDRLRRLMWERVGVERSGEGLAAAAAELAAMMRQIEPPTGEGAALVAGEGGGTVAAGEGGSTVAAGEGGAPPVSGESDASEAAWAAAGGGPTQAAGELRNLVWTGGLVAQAALARRESRGGHYRADYPCPDVTWQHRLFLTAAPDGTACWAGETHVGDSFPAARPETQGADGVLAPSLRIDFMAGRP